uniref:PDZ domain-containing protein n=1 Tax=Sinocyclocheilus rhinocerous TaxID=307959 RepID=A0A673FGW4_9TELE
MQQRYGSLPGELHMFDLDCGSRGSGLGLCLSGNRDGARGRMSVYVSEIKPDGAAAADGRVRVGDELLEINGQVLYGRSHQNATAIINNAPAKVRILLTRNKAAQNQMTTGPDKLKSRSSESLNIGLPAPINATSNHKPSCHPASHMSPSHCTPPSSGVSSADDRSRCGPTANQSSSTGPHSTSYLAQGSVSSDPLTSPIIAGCINTIDICKGTAGLGLSIVGGCNTVLGVIVIHEVNKDGAAHRDGRLWAGDHILKVNGIDLRMATHEEALGVLRLSPQCVRLCIYRDPGTENHSTHTLQNHTPEDMWDLFSVELNLKTGQGLGLRIVGKWNDTGIFVSEITRGGAADLDGRLLLGDQILSVNGEDMRAASQDDASTLLQVHANTQEYRCLCEGKKELNSICLLCLSSPQFQTITLDRGAAGLGFSIIGGFGSSHGDFALLPQGAAVEDRRLRHGDQLLKVNGQSLQGVTHSEAVELLRQTNGLHRPQRADRQTQMEILQAVFIKKQKKPSQNVLFSNCKSNV